jgi:redox-sensitive bicupin YhaK (pirin superfamily)
MWIRKAEERGKVDAGWLTSSFSFSFGEFYDERFMGFSHLRVINDDYIAPRAGFPTHPHRNMEIFSFVVEGRLAHKDSTGAEGEVFPGRIQMMTAGTGIYHSEFNPSSTEKTHLYQIWITPRTTGLTPEYRELSYDPEETRNTLKLLVSPDKTQGSLQIHQQTWIYEAKLDAGQELSLPGESQGWLQLISGKLLTGSYEVVQGDGVAFESGLRSVTAIESSHLLYFVL